MNTKTMITLDVVLLAVTIILGGVLLFSNKHYNIAIFTIHKLAALGATILTVILCIQNVKAIPLSGIFLIAIILAVVSVIALFVTGALLSAGQGAYSSLKTIHCVASISILVSEALIILRILRL